MSDTTFISVDRADAIARATEAEGVLVSDHGTAIRFTLDDGSTLDFDAAELRAILRV